MTIHDIIAEELAKELGAKCKPHHRWANWHIWVWSYNDGQMSFGKNAYILIHNGKIYYQPLVPKPVCDLADPNLIEHLKKVLDLPSFLKETKEFPTIRICGGVNPPPQ
jgi:hypothetical protein